MTLSEDIRAAASTLQEVSSGLASALRIAAKRQHATAGVVDTFREAEALTLTVSAIVDDAAPILVLLDCDATVVGRAPVVGAEKASVRNGFDSLALILLALLRKATDAVSDVAANQSQWLVTPLQANQHMEAMSIHHGQLKALYGLLHLAGKIVDTVDVEETLFLDVAGDIPRPELEPSRWRSAVKTEPLFGRFFGFHYPPELRNFLLIVNIARGSISTAAATTPDSSSPLVRNIARLGWGWLYSHMVLLNNLGVTINQASQIGKDADEVPIEDVRAFMNLSEDPVLTTVSSMASADVAIDFQFEIIPEPLTPPAREDAGASAAFDTLTIPAKPISARVISHSGRPVDRSMGAQSPPSSRQMSRQSSDTGAAASEARLEGSGGPSQLSETPYPDSVPEENKKISEPVSAPGSSNLVPRPQSDEATQQASEIVDGGAVARTGPGEGPLRTLSGFVQQMQDALGSATASALGSQKAARSTAAAASGDADPAEGQVTQEPRDLGKIMTAVQASMAEATDSSMLASAIKTELVKLHSNVSSLLTPETQEPASALIIHFHGGGFVSQSSAGHAVYLKEWAADLPDAVILSVDYALAPEQPYPAALDDCLYAYCWALENTSRLGTTAKRILLCGDSAGGNLAVAVALKARTHGVRPADGICLGYPALYVNVAWSPSRLLSFFDPLLPLSILDMCLRSYIPEGTGEEPHRNPFISPLVADQDALRALPPVVFICGSLDPLLDDSVQFAHNLRIAGRQSDTFRVMEGLCHGFLNMIQVSKDARFASNFLSREMAQLLEIPMQRGGLGADDIPVTAVFDT